MSRGQEHNAQVLRRLGNFEPTSCEGVVSKAQDILARYLDPGTPMSDRECIDELLELLDGGIHGPERAPQDGTEGATARLTTGHSLGIPLPMHLPALLWDGAYED